MLNVENLRSINNRHKDSDLNKGFIQGLIVATTNINADGLTLIRRHLAATRDLSWNYNIIITPPNKSGDAVFMDFTHYNNKIMESLNVRTNLSTNHD